MANQDPQYTLRLDEAVRTITLKIDFDGSRQNEVHVLEGLVRALRNGDLYRVIEHNTWSYQPLLPKLINEEEPG